MLYECLRRVAGRDVQVGKGRGKGIGSRVESLVGADALGKEAEEAAEAGGVEADVSDTEPREDVTGDEGAPADGGPDDGERPQGRRGRRTAGGAVLVDELEALLAGPGALDA